MPSDLTRLMAEALRHPCPGDHSINRTVDINGTAITIACDLTVLDVLVIPKTSNDASDEIRLFAMRTLEQHAERKRPGAVEAALRANPDAVLPEFSDEALMAELVRRGWEEIRVCWVATDDGTTEGDIVADSASGDRVFVARRQEERANSICLLCGGQLDANGVHRSEFAACIYEQEGENG